MTYSFEKWEEFLDVGVLGRVVLVCGGRGRAWRAVRRGRGGTYGRLPSLRGLDWDRRRLRPPLGCLGGSLGPTYRSQAGGEVANQLTGDDRLE